MKVYQQSIEASKSREEVILPQEILGETSIKSRGDEIIDLKSKLLTLEGEVLSIYRDKRKWTTALLLSTVWIMIIVLKELGVESLQLEIVGYIAGGDSGRGLFQIIGSMTLKAVYSYFMVSTVIPILLGEYKFEGWRQSLAKIKNIDYKRESNIVTILLGISASMYVYNFLAGRAFLQNTMIGFIMLVMLFKSYISGKGVLKTTIARLILRAKRSGNTSNIFSDRILVGMLVGSILSIFISILNIAYTGYFLGTLILLGLTIYMGLEYKR